MSRLRLRCCFLQMPIILKGAFPIRQTPRNMISPLVPSFSTASSTYVHDPLECRGLFVHSSATVILALMLSLVHLFDHLR